MAAGPTYDLITSTTLSSAAASIDFQSISQSYTHLRIVMYVPSFSASGQAVNMYFNNDTTSNKSQYVWRQTNASAPAGDWGFSVPKIVISGYGATNTLTSVPTSYFIDILNYTGAQNRILVHAGQAESNTTGRLCKVIARWGGGAAINRITFDTGSGATYGVGTTVSIYGIAKA